jgi:hypothetical protein
MSSASKVILMAAAATAVPVIELDMAGVTAFRHTEWNHDVTGANGDLTMSNGAVHNGVRAPTTGARGGTTHGYKGTKQVIFRKHDLGLKQPNGPSFGLQKWRSATASMRTLDHIT